MATEAQVLANRLNARKSTGPRMLEGKAAVSQNVIKHGLLAKEVVIKVEDPGEFEFCRDRMLMYERRIERSLYRTVAELQRQRLLRELEPPVEGPVRSVAVRVSRSTGILPVILNHGRDVHATETSDGVTTNTPTAAE